MSLPTTLPCPSCRAQLSVEKTDYRGIQQHDPLQDGMHVYLVQADCPLCKIRVVTTHHEREQQ